jgi:pimeloyl-ACP methyl ester carboxylesterase
MKLNIWRENGLFYDDIFYHLNGEPTEIVLCLHGFPSSSHDYHKIWSGLTQQFSVLAFDMIGYGFSAKPTNFNYTTFNQVDILEKLLGHLKVKKVHILAHDYGNTITQELLARRNEGKLDFEISTICMLNGALFPETHRPILAQKLLISPLGAIFGRFVGDSRFRAGLASVFGSNTQPTDEEFADFLAVFNHNQGKRIAHKLIRYMTERTTYRERWVSALESIDVPLRMINGSEDRVSGKHLVNRFREVCPHLTDIIELEGIGHFPHFEAPEKTLGLYLDFRLKVPPFNSTAVILTAVV